MTGKVRVDSRERGSGVRAMVASSMSGGWGVVRVRTWRSLRAERRVEASSFRRVSAARRFWARAAAAASWVEILDFRARREGLEGWWERPASTAVRAAGSFERERRARVRR